MKIALLAKKGGVGKSTVSLLLYEAFRQAGKSVYLHDWDAQGTSSKSLDLIHGKDRPKKIENANIVIYDTPPSLEHTATATAVRSADIVLVVTSPSPADIWEADDAVVFAQGKNPKAYVRVIFNKVRRSTVLGRLVDQSAKQVSVPTLPVTLSARECYQHAVAQGWKALDGAARQEVLQLIVSLLTPAVETKHSPQTTQSPQYKQA
jgi:MinD-like ATPase involved in chromosome partitioning or flagellar assembly